MRWSSDWVREELVTIKARRVLHEVDRRGFPDEQLLASTQADGVVPRSDLDYRVWNPTKDLHNYKLVEPGQFVISLRSFQGGIEHSAHRGIVSPAYTVMSLDTDHDTGFFRYLLKSSLVISQLDALGSGIRQGKSISFQSFGDVELGLPPPAVQKSIAAVLDRETERIDRLVEKKRQLIELLEEKRLSAVYHAITGATGRLTPVAHLASYVNGRAFKPEELGRTGLPVVRIRQMNDPDAEFDYYEGAFDPRHELSSGDLVFSWSASLSVGIWDRGPALLNQHLFKVEPKRGVSIGWLRFALETAIEHFRSLMHGSAMTHLTLDKLKQVKLPLPPISNQERLADQLTEFDRDSRRLLGKVQVQLDRLAEYRQALITAAVTGQIDVTAEAPEPEEVVA